MNLQLLGWALGNLRLLGPTAAYCTPPTCTRDWQGRIVTSAIYIPAGELCPATLTSLKEGEGQWTHLSLGL